MGKAYSIALNPLVVTHDLAKLDQAFLKRLRNSLEVKLTSRPDVYGKPLRSPLHGYWTLRIADYRVVYHIKKKVVYIDIIEHRSVVYEAARARLGL